mmetsp:Transcript_18202/g.39092  ORF Transcript_18202/g.39092 Transcript_18202/m.39092 type:complete len:202 (-) Transcript_18202:1208-1813(-)
MPISAHTTYRCGKPSPPRLISHTLVPLRELRARTRVRAMRGCERGAAIGRRLKNASTSWESPPKFKQATRPDAQPVTRQLASSDAQGKSDGIGSPLHLPSTAHSRRTCSVAPLLSLMDSGQSQCARTRYARGACAFGFCPPPPPETQQWLHPTRHGHPPPRASAADLVLPVLGRPLPGGRYFLAGAVTLNLKKMMSLSFTT